MRLFQSHQGQWRIMAWLSLIVVVVAPILACSSSYTPQNLEDGSPTLDGIFQMPLPMCTPEDVEGKDWNPDALTGRKRTVSLEESRQLFPGLGELQDPVYGFELAEAELIEYRDERDSTEVYYPCLITLRYTTSEPPHTWVELQHPGCISRLEPTESTHEGKLSDDI